MKFYNSLLKGKPGRTRDRMDRHHFPPKLLFIIMGIVSIICFLIRVIPKPTRAGYPCMRVAAPLMSGFISYLLAVSGLTAVSRKSSGRLNVRYGATVLLITGVVLGMAIAPSNNSDTSFQALDVKTGPDNGPNQTIGTAKGVFPGR